MSLDIAQSVQHLPLYQAGKPIEETKRELGLKTVVKLASNENPIGPSPRAAEAIRMALSELHRYPDAAGHELRRALASSLGLPENEILLGNGSNEILVLLMRALAVSGKNVVMGWPSFIVYPTAAQSVGLEARKVPLGAGFKHEAASLLAAVDKNTQAVLLGHPNNPTGTCLPKVELEQLVREVPDSTLIVIDEAYFEYSDAPDYVSGLTLRNKNVVILRTLSKAYGLAGMRLGYAVGDASLLDYLNRLREPFNVNTLAQVGAVAALTDDLHIERVVKLNREERERTVHALLALGLDVTPTQANFALVGFGKEASSIFSALLKQGVIVRPLQPYGMPNHLRISFGTRAENDLLIEALRRALER
jgi:histidinol-phosphate aminotransferase